MRLFCLLFLGCLTATDALNIVVWLMGMAPSHMSFTNSLTEHLAERGHTVDLVLQRVNPMIKGNGTGHLRRFFAIDIDGPSPWSNLDYMKRPFEMSDEEALSTAKLFALVSRQYCNESLNTPELFEWLRQGDYDVAVASFYDFCAHGIFHHVGVRPLLTFSSMPLLDIQQHAHNLPSPPSFVTLPIWSRIDNVLLSFMERLENVIDAANFEFHRMPDFYEHHDAMFRKTFGPKFPSAKTLAESSPITFVNTNELIDVPRPISSQIKYIGGITVKKPTKPLETKFERILSRSKSGVVLFSLGTQIPSTVMPLSVKASFIRAFARFPDHIFLWKHEENDNDADLLKNATNIATEKWLPQTELLYDRRVKAFISHMGLNSLQEAAHAGVPLLAVPLFADQVKLGFSKRSLQIYNTRVAKSRGIAVKVPRDAITEESIVAALKELLIDKKMQKRSEELARMLAKKPEKPSETFLHWVEFAAEFKDLGKLTKMQSHDFFIYYGIDVVLFLTVCAAVVILALLYLIGVAAKYAQALVDVLRVQLRTKSKTH